MNLSKLTRHCGLTFALGLAVAGSAWGQDIGYRSGDTPCIGCRLEIGGLVSEGATLDARWDGQYVLTTVTHSARSLRVHKELDKASPKLQEAFSKGTPLPEVTLTVPQGEGSRKYNPYITVDYIERIRMENVYVTSYQTGGSQGDGSKPTETFSLNFTAIKFESKEAPGFVPEEADEVIVGFGQGDDGEAPPVLVAAVADLLPLNGLSLSTTFIGGGQTATISTDAASSKQGGRCFFRYRYDTGNQGQAGAAGTTNRIHLDAANGPSLADDALPGLAAGDQHTASGLLPLVVGTWTLYVHADDDLLVAEGDEQNNLRRVRVRVEGSCEDKAPTLEDVTPPSPTGQPLSDQTVTALSFAAGGGLTSTLNLSANVSNTRTKAVPEIGTTSQVLVSLQPALSLSKVWLAVTPRTAWTRVTNDLDDSEFRTDQYQLVVRWSPPWAGALLNLEVASDWNRSWSHLDPEPPSFDRRTVLTLSLNWRADRMWPAEPSLAERHAETGLGFIRL